MEDSVCTKIKNQVNDLYSGKKVALFLDIDGILHKASKSLGSHIKKLKELESVISDIVGEKKRPQEFGLLEEAPQQLLAEVLEKYPQVVIVISSAWRYWEEFPHGDANSLSWLKSVLHPSIAARIVGKTPCDEDSRLVTRLEEIRSFMRQYSSVLDLNDAWVAIDDQIQHFPHEEVCPFYCENHVGRHVGVSGTELVLIIDGENALTQLSASILEAAVLQASYNVPGSTYLAKTAA